ncbi:MAG TPA: HIRAN domain-containing protein, partial [Candidatus Hydrogenedentes bacterium]|nr:HIRAN domain-containing protein [Candidatus Hydrogenedentota bacterium]
MSKKTCQHEVLLGEIEVNLAGMQYCRAHPALGEKVHFEREPDNTHDRKAIRVENEDFAKVGYLPRQVASWLTPLIDQGTVYVDGTVAARDDTPFPSATLALSLYVAPSKAEFLQTPRDPASLPEALHRVVLDGYNAMHDWRRPTVIRDAAKRLGELSRRDLLPETRLLLALMPKFAQTLETHADIGALSVARSALAELEIGEGLHYRNATVFPLYLANGHERTYVLLEEALEAGTADVTETSHHGTVPEILIRNRGDRPILLPEGEILTGAKQNRVINITILVAAQSELVVPVSCVEQGRWSSVSRRFRAT